MCTSFVYTVYFLSYHIFSIIHRSVINACCKPTLHETNAGSLINAGGWHNIHIAIITPAMATKRKAYTVATNPQAVEVAEKMSEEAAAMLVKIPS